MDVEALECGVGQVGSEAPGGVREVDGKAGQAFKDRPQIVTLEHFTGRPPEGQARIILYLPWLLPQYHECIPTLHPTNILDCRHADTASVFAQPTLTAIRMGGEFH